MQSETLNPRSTSQHPLANSLFTVQLQSFILLSLSTHLTQLCKRSLECVSKLWSDTRFAAAYITATQSIRARRGDNGVMQCRRRPCSWATHARITQDVDLNSPLPHECNLIPTLDTRAKAGQISVDDNRSGILSALIAATLPDPVTDRPLQWDRFRLGPVAISPRWPGQQPASPNHTVITQRYRSTSAALRESSFTDKGRSTLSASLAVQNGGVARVSFQPPRKVIEHTRSPWRLRTHCYDKDHGLTKLAMGITMSMAKGI